MARVSKWRQRFTQQSVERSQWNDRLLAERLGDVSEHQVWRILRKRDIQLHRRRSWCISTDPEFGPKAADVVGLYLNPPENALVLSVDEKPHIQALGTCPRLFAFARRQSGKRIQQLLQAARYNNLVCSPDIVTGEVKAGHYPRRRRRNSSTS